MCVSVEGRGGEILLISCAFCLSAQVNVAGKAAVVITTLCAVWLLALSGVAAKVWAKAVPSMEVRLSSQGWHNTKFRAHHYMHMFCDNGASVSVYVNEAIYIIPPSH